MPFALACSGMYAANTLGLDAGQGQVEQRNPKRRGIGAVMCQALPELQDDTDPASNFSWLLYCAFLVHISLLVNKKGKLQAYSVTHASKVRKQFV